MVAQGRQVIDEWSRATYTAVDRPTKCACGESKATVCSKRGWHRAHCEFCQSPRTGWHTTVAGALEAL